MEQPTNDTGIILLLQVPRTNDKRALAAEQLFASLHGLLTREPTGLFGRQANERVSLEVAVSGQHIGFYVWTPTYLRHYVEQQLYAQYPDVQITEVPDYMQPSELDVTVAAGELRLRADSLLPIKTFPNFDVDPLAAITAAFTHFEPCEEAWLQLVVRPLTARRQRRAVRRLASWRGGVQWRHLLAAFWQPPGSKASPAKAPNERQRLRLAAAEEKNHKLAYEATLRIAYRGQVTASHAQLRLQAIGASFQQFSSTHLNSFTLKRLSSSPGTLAASRARSMAAPACQLNIEEVATLYHLPHTTVTTPNVIWAPAQTAEPPLNLPLLGPEQLDSISPIGVTNFRERHLPFGLPRGDRGRHVYILGQTGVGKTGLLELLCLSDMYHGHGFAVIDPHGDLAQDILRRMPASRQHGVVYFNAADTEFPVAFNPLEQHDGRPKAYTCSQLISALRYLFDSWGPRLEHVLRFSILALLDYPHATMLDITRLLTDKTFRALVLEYVSDPVVRTFWRREFASWNDRFAAEAVAPVLNKVGAFTANPLIRNIIGQPKSNFNIRNIMDERKCLVVNLSRGLIGEDNAALLGALMVTELQMAAMSRADIPAKQRVPFYLYVDEFQNFTTESFVTILSEARKFGLYLTIANQYISQMPPTIRDAVFGNVGTIAAFRLSADDARCVSRYFQPSFTDSDLIHLHNRHFVLTTTINGERTLAFSCVTLNLPAFPHAENYTNLVAASRKKYGVLRTVTEALIQRSYRLPGKQRLAHTSQRLALVAGRFGDLALRVRNRPAVRPHARRHRTKHRRRRSLK